MKSLFEQTINWAKIGNHSKEEYNYTIGRAVLDQEKKILTIDVCLNFIIPYDVLTRIEKTIKGEFPDLSGVSFRMRFEEMILTKEEIIKHYIDYMINEVNGGIAHLTKTIFKDNFTLENDKLTIMALGAAAVDQLNQKAAGQFSRILERDFQMKFTVVFENHEEDYTEKYQRQKEEEEKELEALRKAISQAVPPKKAKSSASGGGNGGGVSGNRIMGKAIDGSITPISEVSRESGSVVIEAQVFEKSFRAIKNNRQIMSLLVTDKKNSICVKAFLNEDKWQAVDESINEGTWLLIKGNAEYDTFENTLVIMAKDIQRTFKETRKDLADEKRIELHAHTKMSAMDGLIDIEQLISTVAGWGHKAVAITDHGVVQAFPDAAKYVKKKKLDLKLILGMEGYLFDDGSLDFDPSKNLTTKDEYIVFDLETTGLSPVNDEIIEIGAVRVKDGQIVDTYSTFVKPERDFIPPKITELTGITYDMVADARRMDEVFPEFKEYIGDTALAAHNADFDMSFIRSVWAKKGLVIENPVIDTLFLSRKLLPDMSRHKLNLVAKKLGVSLENHHRAVDDAAATAEILLKLFLMMEEQSMSKIGDLTRPAAGTIDIKSKNTNHIIVLVKNKEGLKNLYKLVSLSHLEYFYRRPRLPRAVLTEHREGLILGSACEAGEVYAAILAGKPEKEIIELANYYDYLEVQPLVNNRFLINNGKVADEEALRDINRKIVELGRKTGKPVCATSDAHYAEPEEALYRTILMSGQNFKDAEGSDGLYLRTTDEMLKEFAYLGEETAREVVIDNPAKIADMIEEVAPVPEGKFPPKIDNGDEILRRKCMETAIGIYGEPLPEDVGPRLEKELNSIISNGYAVMYVSAELLVQKSLADGYLVGSRGSVGSSFAATMAGITEVNPLPPHYVCENPDCKHSQFVTDGSYDCGVDMPDKNCPNCGRPYKKDGFNIPFETFLGFEGDKEPDIDLNFAGEYQPVAHKFVEEIFGRENVYRAGTIGTVASKTAYGFVMKYHEEKEKTINKWEAERLTRCCTGVRRTTGQHPGGIIIVPRGNEIYEFCPVQHPANDMNTDIVTTHFDYHSIDENLLKLDILGHDVPSMIRYLQDMTGVDPLKVPLRDEKTDGIFNGIEGLDIKLPDYEFKHGTYGIPEFGTKFVRQMLDDTKPAMFADLVRISGFSHGTDVWLNNAQEFIRSGEATIKDAISTRDDIMNYLILKGLPHKSAFKIMENVRKGKGLSDDDVALMEENKVPEWYIESCRRIKYMFPKAHAVAYVMMSYRIAWYKVYYPAEFYAVFFTMKISDFNADVILKGIPAIRSRIVEIQDKGREAKKKEEDEMIVLEAALEMYARGYEFLPADLEQSDGLKFKVVDGKVLLPYLALNGVGESAARNIAEELAKGSFFSIEDMRVRAKLNKTAVEALVDHGVVAGLPETDQMSLF